MAELWAGIGLGPGRRFAQSSYERWKRDNWNITVAWGRGSGCCSTSAAVIAFVSLSDKRGHQSCLSERQQG